MKNKNSDFLAVVIHCCFVRSVHQSAILYVQSTHQYISCIILFACLDFLHVLCNL